MSDGQGPKSALERQVVAELRMGMASSPSASERASWISHHLVLVATTATVLVAGWDLGLFLGLGPG